MMKGQVPVTAGACAGAIASSIRRKSIKKAIPLKGKDKFYVGKTISGDYTINRLKNADAPWAERWGFKNYEEARNYVRKLNSGRYKLSFFTKNLKKVV